MPREITPRAKGVTEGTGWREEGRASCQQPVGKGVAWEGHSGPAGGADTEEPLGERGGVPGPLGNNKDGRSRGTEGKGGGVQPEREGRRVAGDG